MTAEIDCPLCELVLGDVPSLVAHFRLEHADRVGCAGGLFTCVCGAELSWQAFALHLTNMVSPAQHFHEVLLGLTAEGTGNG